MWYSVLIFYIFYTCNWSVNHIMQSLEIFIYFDLPKYFTSYVVIRILYIVLNFWSFRLNYWLYIIIFTSLDSTYIHLKKNPHLIVHTNRIMYVTHILASMTNVFSKHISSFLVELIIPGCNLTLYSQAHRENT